ncbi:hypothetical protein M885DRAFT_527210 [Pelagophyceae sp. CCMP2097]|nr:hypothetical protein M885DRAFT_527210 [Pelagophyceae sp. CCMP2097]
MSLMMGGGGGGMMAGGGGAGGLMPMPSFGGPSMPQAPESGAPQAQAFGASAPSGLGDPRSCEDSEAALGGDACLALELGGAAVRSAMWDWQKKKVSVASARAACLSVADAPAVAAWLAKSPKARAAEFNKAGLELFERAAPAVLAPGRALGCDGAPAAMASTADGVKVVKAKACDDDEAWAASSIAYKVGDKRISPEQCVALLAGAARSRATQMVARAVRRCWVVLPSFASVQQRKSCVAALSEIDTRVVRVVSAPLAMAVGALCRQAMDGHDDLAEHGLLLSVDVSCQGIDVVLLTVGDNGSCTTLNASGAPLAANAADALMHVALEDVALEADEAVVQDVVPRDMAKFEGIILKAIQNHIKSASIVGGVAQTVARCVVRGDSAAALYMVRSAVEKCSKMAIFQAENDDAVHGATLLAASKRELQGAPLKLRAGDVLAHNVGVAQWKSGDLCRGALLADVDALFEAMAPLPCSARRAFSFKETGSVESLVLACRATADDKWTACGEAGDPYETVDDAGELTKAAYVTFEISVDACGIPNAQVLVAGAPASAGRQVRQERARRSRWYTWAGLLVFFGGPVCYTLAHMSRRAVTRNRTIVALNDFYARANPGKATSAASVADKYEGFEELLFQRLEKQYPGHLVIRPGSVAPKAEAEEDAQDEQTTEL